MIVKKEKKKLALSLNCKYGFFILPIFLLLFSLPLFINRAQAIDGLMNGKTITGQTDDYLFWLQTYDKSNSPYYFDRFFINKDGYIGVDTTTINTNYRINVAGGAKFTQVVDGIKPQITQTNAFTTVGYIDDALSSKVSWGGDILKSKKLIGSNDNYDIGLKTNNLERLTILKNGNVGIGTMNPGAKLDIVTGGASVFTRFIGASTDIFQLGNDASGLFQEWNASTAAKSIIRFQTRSAGAGSYVQLLLDAGNQNIRLNTNSTERVRIDSLGNFGIGTTNPVYKLDVAGGAKFTHVVDGVTPLETQTNALTTVSYVNSALSNPTTAIVGFWTKNADNTIYNTNLANVGIGKTNPTQKLDVVGNALVSGNIDTNTLTVSGAGNSSFAGNVGIGTDNPLAKLQINNQAVFNQTTPGPASYYGIHFNGQTTSDYATGITWNGGSSGTQAGIYVQGSGSYGTKMYFATTNAYVVGAQNRMMIDHVGNVGIGKTNPGYKLDIAGGARFTAVVDGVTPLETQTNALTTVSYVNSALSNPTTAIVGFWKKDGNNISNTNSANVGIGKTNPAQKLDVTGNALVSGNVNASTLTISGAGNSSFVGNVGIGTTNPTYKLDVVGGAKFTQVVDGITPLETQTNALTTVSYVNSALSNPTTAIVGFWKKDGNNISNTNSANVGIGKTNPAQKLDVTGNALVSGNVNASTLTISGAGNSSFVGNVGIGTTNPTYKLDVVGGAKFTQVVDGITPLETQTDAFATVGYIASALSNPTMETIGFWTKSTSTNDIYNASGTANVGIGTDSPTSLLTLANNKWLSAISGSGTGGINMFKLNTNNQIEVGAPLLIGPLEFAANSGLVSFLDMPITASSPSGTPHGYAMKLDGNNILTVHAKSDGSGGVNNIGVGIGTASPQYSLDVNGSINFTGDLYMNGGILQAGKWSSNGARIYYNDGNVGIGTTTPSQKLTVDGGANFTQVVDGISPQTNQKNAFTTVGYINDVISSINAGVTGAYLPLAGGTMSGTINMGGKDINNVGKITAQTVDPLYRISGINYSTFAPSVVGGVKEEYVGRTSVNKLSSNGEYEAVIDFSKAKQGSDMWVFRKVVDYSPDNIDVLITPYGSFANTYYKIEDEKIIIRADRPVSVSYRLTGKRHDWRNWPTKAIDQKEAPSFIIN